MNQASSRSHCIFTLAIEGRDLQTDVIRTSKLHLVDLAGSERVYKSDLAATTIKTEARYINRSLSYLEQVIIALHDKAQGNRVHVPYRNSMMTSILRDSLGGNCRTVMIANLSTDISNEEETISTARFALRCQKLVNQLYRNEHLDTDIAMQKLQTENTQLRTTIQRQDEIIRQQNELLKYLMSVPNSPARTLTSEKFNEMDYLSSPGDVAQYPQEQNPPSTPSAVSMSESARKIDDFNRAQ